MTAASMVAQEHERLVRSDSETLAYAPVRFELTGPGGDRWTFGDGGEGSVLRGDGLELCLIAVKRQDPADATTITITTEGEAAQVALRAVRCFP